MIRKFLASFRSAASDRKGVSAAEYAILAVAIVIIVGAAVLQFGTTLRSAFGTIGTEISSAITNAQTSGTR